MGLKKLHQLRDLLIQVEPLSPLIVQMNAWIGRSFTAFANKMLLKIINNFAKSYKPIFWGFASPKAQGQRCAVRLSSKKQSSIAYTLSNWLSLCSVFQIAILESNTEQQQAISEAISQALPSDPCSLIALNDPSHFEAFKSRCSIDVILQKRDVKISKHQFE